MPLIPLKIPPGVYRVGTDYEGSNRWRDANLIRWHQGSMRPVGGWRDRTDASSSFNAAPRAMHAWVDNSADTKMVLGSANELVHVSGSGAITDITPSGFTTGNDDAQQNTGFGGSFYGTSYYGVSRPITGGFDECDVWALDNWGEYLVGCSTSDGKLYEWALQTALGADVVTNGSFATDSDWTKGTGWAIASGVASWTGTTAADLEQAITGLRDNTAYQLKITVIDPDNDANPATIPSAKIKVVGTTTTTELVNETLSIGENTIDFTTDDVGVTVYVFPATDAEPNFDVDDISLKRDVKAAQIANSPTSCKSLVVTEERFIFALQADGNPRKIAWCDREDNTTWTADATNEAGDIELQSNGEIMCAARMRGRTIIVTTTDAHIATYQGPPYVYGFERVGTSCGAVSRNSLVALDQGAFWMGSEGFYMFDGSTAKMMPCDVQDYIFDDINTNQASKTFGVHNSEFGEIWWFYASDGSTEIDKYVAFDYLENHWEVGELNRTTGCDQGVYGHPIWVDETGVLYDHEVEGAPHDSATPFAETGPISIGTGENIMKVNNLIPDEATQGDVQAIFKTRFHPNDTERSYGPYTMSNPTSVRFSGRQVRMRVEATSNADFRVGTMRVNAEQGGRR